MSKQLIGVDEIDLDNLKFKIRKSTPKIYRRMKIFVKRPNAEIFITNKEKWFSIESMVTAINHEFLHWIICILTKTKPKQYDKYLESCRLYWHEILIETKL